MLAVIMKVIENNLMFRENNILKNKLLELVRVLGLWLDKWFHVVHAIRTVKCYMDHPVSIQL